MKIHVLQIPHEGLYLEGEDPKEVLDVQDDNLRAAGPLFYGLDIGLSKGGLFATGWLEADFEMRCVKCLQWFRRKVHVDSFACQIELSGRELVDLTPCAREDIFLALPAHPHCDWDGENRCPGVTPAPEGEPPSEAAHAWDALDQLKIQSKKKKT